MIQVLMVPPEQLSKAWLVAEPFLKKAVDLVDNRLSTFDVWECIIKNEYQLWIIADDLRMVGSFVTNIQQHPRTRGINVPYLGAEDHSLDLFIDQALEKIAEFGKANGCTIMEFYGRPGWKKHLSAQGFNPFMMIFEKAI